jgi:hypothetical protein
MRLRCGSTSGPAVALAEQQEIFERFYCGRSSEPGGVGLGSSLVRQIARYCGGGVGYEVRPGGGSRFLLNLPCGGPAIRLAGSPKKRLDSLLGTYTASDRLLQVGRGV